MYKEQLALLLTLLFAFLVIINIILSTSAKLYFWYAAFKHLGFELGLKMLVYELAKPFYLAMDFDISCSVVGGKNVLSELAPAITFCKQLVFPKYLAHHKDLLVESIAFSNLLRELDVVDPGIVSGKLYNKLIGRNFDKLYVGKFVDEFLKIKMMQKSGNNLTKLHFEFFNDLIKSRHLLLDFDTFGVARKYHMEFVSSLVNSFSRSDSRIRDADLRNLSALVFSFMDYSNKVYDGKVDSLKAALTLFDTGGNFGLSINNDSHLTTFDLAKYSFHSLDSKIYMFPTLEKKQGDFIMIKEVDGVYLPVTYVELKSLNNVDNGALLSGNKELIKDIARTIGGVFRDKQLDAVSTDFNKKILIYIPGITATEAELIGITSKVEEFVKMSNDPYKAQFEEFKNNGGSVQIITDKRINFDNDLD
jgi:hypothetical protein